MRPPQQTRSRRTLDRISKAALELIEEVGAEGVTVAGIVERAGTSVGSFYARFPGKEELIRYLQERVWTEARGRWDEAVSQGDWGSLSLEAVVERVVHLLILSYRSDFQRQWVLGRAQVGEGDGARILARFHRHLLESILPLLLARRKDITHPDPGKAVSLGYRMVVGAIRETTDQLEVGGDPVAGDERPWDDLGVELARAWMAYLSRAGAPEIPSEPGVVDFFDPWGA